MVQHYKDLSGNTHELPDEAFEYMLPSGCVKISDTEFFALTAPVLPTLAESTVKIIAQVKSLRLPIFALLDGKQASALATGDTAKALVIENAKILLRDITALDISTKTTEKQIFDTFKAQWLFIAGGVPLDVKAGFLELLK